MKRLFLFLSIFGLLALPARAQQKNPKAKSSKTATAKKQHATRPTHAKPGKSSPNETGSGMTVPVQDQPNLDNRPNPAATVPSRDIQADKQPNPTP